MSDRTRRPGLSVKASARAAEFALVLADWAVILLATLAAYWMRFEGSVPEILLPWVPWLVVAAILAYTPSLAWLGLYRQVWRYASVGVLIRLASAAGAGTLILLLINALVKEPYVREYQRLWPLSVIFGLGVFVFIGTSALRILPRALLHVRQKGSAEPDRTVLIVGAGDAGSLLLRDIEQQPEIGMHVIGFLDDHVAKHGRSIRSVNVLGPVSALHDVVERYGVDEVFVAMPTVDQDTRRRILDACVAEGVKTRVMSQLAVSSDSVGLDDLRKVRIEDLLGREPVEIDIHAIAETIEGKVVAVTGAAGSIGSELCRQVAALSPRQLVLIDMDESRLYDLAQEMLRLGTTDVSLRICDVRDLKKTTDVLAEETPDLLFHAAAYKHVPLMELAPDEAVKANVLGTQNTLRACADAGVSRFVLISTDKAVHPTTVMGRTKAVAELLTLRTGREGDLQTSTVRFGNVLGSRGSVVPLFEEQLRDGGPITVTHPDVTRYFMTIPEAARLVLHAQALSGDGGEIFVLEMGEPVKIEDVARKMIMLSGAKVDIEYTGLRPAEKLHEVLVHQESELLPTGATKINRTSSLPLLQPDFDRDVDALIECAVTCESDEIARRLEEFVDRYAE